MSFVFPGCDSLLFFFEILLLGLFLWFCHMGWVPTCLFGGREKKLASSLYLPQCPTRHARLFLPILSLSYASPLLSIADTVLSMQSFDEEDKDRVVTSSVPKELSHVPIPGGKKFVYQVLNGPNERCLENFRMDKPVFYKLCDILQTRGLLRHTNRIKIEEQLAIFLFIIGHNLRTRAVQELFRYSGETISRHFNNVLNAVMAISTEFFHPPGPDIPHEIMDDPRLYPYFKDCVGVVDGIHIPVMVGVDEQGPFRNKKGLLTQNVLAAFSLDLRFHYVLAGWEGSASDEQVLAAALTRRNKFHVPEGKYYLVDSKYPNIPGFIAAYDDVKVQTGEEPNGYHPKDPKELFNQRHLLLHVATNRIFGALKERFPILLSAPPYPLQTQVKLVIVACALHNFVLSEKPDDFVFRMFENDRVAGTEDASMASEQEQEQLVQDEKHGLEPMGFTQEQMEDSLRLRDEIASALWDNYVHQDLS
ncbi:PREDICTED: putative nuclease HARBI1 isoform X1 [Tarenaya hassleriana]|uniref:putative nuclease HARBI1 isoform X1 n=2 Tax=Tarenaya hassleriana TaxID=28532 RepID=UPI00053C5E09|nr:PREDICTED: putative nuclease HARBI1 isoform X1 [Tarenaya hassleriana]XP_010524210.1 PREDICTED: putative nuclease HARBI1 isoform X1 [Tarenaya hassleriana]